MSPSDPPTILAFDTSAAHCAAALVSAGRILAARVEPMERGQAERMFPLLEELLAEAALGWSDLAALAVCTGPGNFTGLRIAVAAARGLALALGIPAIGVTRFDALAAERPGLALVALDARRGQVFAQLLRDGDPAGAPMLIDAAALPGLAPEAARLGAAARPDSPEAVESPSPVAIARVAATRLGAPQPPPAPLYLRPADASPASEPAPLILDDA